VKRPENGGVDIKNLSDQELQLYMLAGVYSVVESELTVRCRKLILAMAEEELEFRKWEKPRRPKEEWNQLWVQAVNEVAEGEVAEDHGLSPKDAWETARRVIPRESNSLRANSFKPRIR
jgi:hypothetical protein